MCLLTSYLQREIYDEITTNVPELKEELDKVNSQPDHANLEVMEKNMIEMLKVIPFAHVVGVNLVISMIGTMAATIGVDMITDIIEEINQNTFNDD